MRSLTILCFIALCVPAFAEIDEQQAFEMARAYAIAQEPDLSNPSTQITKKFSNQVIQLDLSDPYSFNGQTFWRNYSWYEYSGFGRAALYSGVGNLVHNPRASAPMASDVAADLQDRVIDWLAFWDARSSLDPNLKVGARRTKLFLYRFSLGLLQPSVAVAVDDQGKLFEPDPSNTLYPWPAGEKVDPTVERENYLRRQMFREILSAD